MRNIAIFSADESSFYGILVKHIHCLLQQRSDTYGKTSNWVLSEAMDLRKLHIGGTFKNALARKLDEVVIPLFAEVIALADHNYNLSHLKQLSHEQSAVQEFWLRMFSDPKVLQLNYSEIIGREKVPVLDDNFKCQLPFSWLIKEAVDNHWELAKTTSGKHAHIINGISLSVNPFVHVLCCLLQTQWWMYTIICVLYSLKHQLEKCCLLLMIIMHAMSSCADTSMTFSK